MNEEDQKFRRLRTACIPAHDVNIAGVFIKALARPEGQFFSAFYLHHYVAFQHVNRNLCVVAVDRA